MVKTKANKAQKKPQTFIAMDYGAHSIKFAVGIHQGGKLKVTAAFIQPLPIGLYENGMIMDSSRMAEIIRGALKQHKIKEKRVVVTIESTEVIKREMTIPKVDPADRMDLITYEVGQYLPIDVNNYVLQYKVVKEETQGEREVTQILLGAMPKEIVRRHFDTLKAAGLTPVAMDLHTNVLSKLVNHIKNGNLKTVDSDMIRTTAFIDFGYERIDINIMEGETNRFNRILRMGIGGVDHIIADILKAPIEDVEAKRLRFSEDSMLSLKKAYDALQTLRQMHHYEDEDGIALDESSINGDNEQRVMAIQESFEYLYQCLDEIDKVFKYYLSRGLDIKIDQIVVYGGAALNKDFNRFIQERLDMPCYTFDASQYLSLQIKNAQDSPLKFVNAFGALIR